MPHGRVLIVDDDPLQRWGVRQHVEKWGWEALEASNGTAAREAYRTHTPDIVLLDLRLEGESGFDVLKEIKAIDAAATVIMITGQGELEDAITGFRLGLSDFFSKPVDFGALYTALQARLEARQLREVASRTRAAHLLEHPIIGQSPAITEAIHLMQRVATSDATTVLLQGESGTGKDLFAKALHSYSARRDEPFIAVNCAALPDTLLESELFGHERGAFTDARAMKRGVFELADKGTLYLDEIGEMKPPLQAKLLRAIEDYSFRRIGGVQDIKVDTRIVAASNRNLEQAVQEGAFRADLYYRLAVIQITLPPLRQRRTDIPTLVEHFVTVLGRRVRRPIVSVSDEAMEALCRYDWPGNVRELRNAIERALILEEGEELTERHLPSPHLSMGVTGHVNTRAGTGGAGFVLPPKGVSLERVEEDFVRQAMELAHGNQTQAAKLLDVSRDALRYRLKKFGIHFEEHTAEP